MVLAIPVSCHIRCAYTCLVLSVINYLVRVLTVNNHLLRIVYQAFKTRDDRYIMVGAGTNSLFVSLVQVSVLYKLKTS